jgi:hypothetical protein
LDSPIAGDLERLDPIAFGTSVVTAKLDFKSPLGYLMGGVAVTRNLTLSNSWDEEYSTSNQCFCGFYQYQNGHNTLGVSMLLYDTLFVVWLMSDLQAMVWEFVAQDLSVRC